MNDKMAAQPTPPTAAPLRKGAGQRCNVVPFFSLSGSEKNSIGTILQVKLPRSGDEWKFFQGM